MRTEPTKSKGVFLQNTRLFSARNCKMLRRNFQHAWLIAFSQGNIGFQKMKIAGTDYAIRTTGRREQLRVVRNAMGNQETKIRSNHASFPPSAYLNLMAKFYKTIPGADDLPRFKFSNWWNGFENAALSFGSSSTKSGQERIDEHAVWLTALLADIDKSNKAGVS